MAKKATTEETATAGKGPAARPVAYAVRIRPALAAQLTGRPTALIPVPTGSVHGSEAAPMSVNLTPAMLTRGDRLYLVEFHGAPTGRADLVEIISLGPPLEVRRTWAWHREAPDDLSALGYDLVPVDGPLLEALPFAPPVGSLAAPAIAGGTP